MRTFGQIVNNKIFEYFGRITEANVVEWFTNFINKTSNFLDVWMKKGGTKYKVDTSKGVIQSNKNDIKLDINELKKIWSPAKLYKKCYPATSNFINNILGTFRPETIDKSDWEKVVVQMYVYTPEINYSGENYPCGVAIYPQKRLDLIEGYFNIQSFETSTMIENKEIINKIFEAFVTDLKKSVASSAKGLTIYTKTPGKYSIYQFQGKRFETTEIKNDPDEEQKDKDKSDEEVDKDKNKKTITVLKMDF
ncbi:MAG: hypothetical protein J1F35_05980 [Erysipelotrichales bacterium]|nr:hypothetical protein [Erysipelotrichales bacterium]